MTRKKRTLLILLVVTALLLPVAGWWYLQRNYTGSRSGVVVDAATGLPIEGAVVCMQWHTGGFFTLSAGVCAAAYETKTDVDGQYFIPSQKLEYSFRDGDVHPEEVCIYKDGYCGYKVYGDSVGRTFGHKNEVQLYLKKQNKVRLYALMEMDSHVDHLEWIRAFGVYNWAEEMLMVELADEEERARDERRK